MAEPKTSKRPLLIAFLLCLITGAVFHDVLTAGFVRWDDNLHIYENPLLHPASWSHLGQFWSAPYGHLYIPVSYTLYWLLAHMAQLPAPLQKSDGYSADLNPQVFHVANLLLQMFNVLLVFTLLRRLLPGKEKAVHDWAAGAGALLFAIHPVQVESVAWISEMRGLLSGALSLLALLCYVRSAQSDRGRLWYCLATVFFGLALLAKPSAIAVFLIAALLDSLILRRPWKTWLCALAPWGMLCVALVFLTRGVQPVTMEIVTPLWARPFVAGDSLTFALGKLLWPSHLGIDYGRNPVWLMSHRWAYVSGLPALGMIVLAWAMRKRLPGIAAAVGLFVAALLPTLGLTPFIFQIYSTVADRYLYLALLGPALGLAWGLEQLWEAGEEKARLRLYASVACCTALFSAR